MSINWIKKNDAMIVWNLDKYNKQLMEFHVYRYTPEQRKEGLGNPRYRHCRFSTGNCYFSAWTNLKKEEVVCECLFILLNFGCNRKCYKHYLHELGKIEELECIRKMLYAKFPEYNKNYTYSEFIEEKYRQLDDS